jgi:hypothetical protein
MSVLTSRLPYNKYSHKKPLIVRGFYALEMHFALLLF